MLSIRMRLRVSAESAQRGVRRPSSRWNRLAVKFSLIFLTIGATTTQADGIKTRSVAGRRQPGGFVTGGVVARNYETALAMTDAERARRRQAGMSRVETRSPHLNLRQSSYTEKVDGRRNPELFFRHELFDELLMALCPLYEHHDAAKRDWGPALRSIGVDDSLFWGQLERSVGSCRSAHCLRRGVTVPDHRDATVRVKSAHGEFRFSG
jgi:hypothetical protein